MYILLTNKRFFNFRVMIPATLVDRRPAMLHLFRNYNAPYDEHYQMRDARFPRPPVPSGEQLNPNISCITYPDDLLCILNTIFASQRKCFYFTSALNTFYCEGLVD